MLRVSVYRFNPETDANPQMQEYQVETGGRDLMVLDVLEMIKAEHDASVTYRRSCREGVCGSDGLNINGKNGLACITPLSDAVKNDKLVVRPLPGLPVVRDLVVDMSLFYAQYEKIEPYLHRISHLRETLRCQIPPSALLRSRNKHQKQRLSFGRDRCGRSAGWSDGTWTEPHFN